MSGRGAWRIGGYVADELIGYGASAQVWRGHVGRGGEAVALKVLDLGDGAAVRAAKTEAALLSTLDHPHLVRLRGLVPDGESVVLVLELAAGGSLADLLARRGRLSPGEVVVALSPIAAALAYAHDAGVVHCDVSPANVLFRGDGSPLLADLGVARLVGGFDAPRSTLAYVDPGVAAGGVPSDASDVFMVAATAFHALTGTPPWTGGSAEAILDQAAGAEIPGLEHRLVGIPAAVAEVVRRGLDPSPAARGSAAEFALDLRHAAAPVPVDLDAGPSPAGRGAAGSRGPVYYSQPGEVDAAGRRTSVPVTDAVSRRAVARAQPTSVVAGDGARNGSAGRVGSSAGDGFSDSTDGGRPTSGAPSSAPERAHVPRHAARAMSSGAVSTPPTAEQTHGPPPVVLERPDFTRPGDTRARLSVSGSAAVGVGWAGIKGADAVAGSSRGLTPADSSRRNDGLTGEGSVRPARAVPGYGAVPSEPPLALTHIVRARIRPPEHPPSRRWFAGAPAWTRTAAVAATVVLLVAGGALATWLRWAPTGSTASTSSVGPTVSPSTSGSSSPSGSAGVSNGPPPTRTGATPSRPVPSAQGAPTAHSSTPPGRASPPAPPRRSNPSSPTPPATIWPRTQQGWAALLNALDRRRQVAFATGDPAPLAEVYVDGVLLDQDRRTLAQVVRPGCRLVGLRTSYRDVHVSLIAAQRSVLTAQASLSASRLECSDQPTRVVSAHAPVSMTLVLTPAGGRILIAGISMPT